MPKVTEGTNRNAVDMTKLANAIKIVGSQAASAGVSIEDATALVGTMIATTQQSGETNARALRSVLMSITQVAGEIDSETGEVLNADDLTKYEKAVNALGVSLKTVEDGAIKLRDPIEILKELSVAYNQLDVDDSRRANLLSAIGGRYRANALDALLKNWDTYEKMLQDFSEGQGSAAREAEKTANSWEGTLNKFENSMTKLVNNFVTSGRAETLINFFTTIVNGADKVASAFGAVGTAVGVLSAIMISKSKSLHFSYDAETKSINLGTTALKNMTAATLKQTAVSIGMKAATMALNTVITAGLSFAISGVVSLFTSWLNKEEELEQEHKRFIEELEQTNEKYQETAQSAEEYLATYKEIKSKNELTEEDRNRLLEIEKSIIETYGKQAEGIDLVNGKLKEQLGILETIADSNYRDAWSGALTLIDEAKQATQDNNEVRVIDIGYSDADLHQFYELANILKEIDGFIEKTDTPTFGASKYVVGLDPQDSAKNVEMLTEALKRLNEETTREQKDTNAFRSVRNRLQSHLEYYQNEVKLFEQRIQTLGETLVKGLSPEQIGTTINWRNVAESNFKEWYDAVISYYNSNYDQEYVDAVNAWFKRNYTSIAERLAMGGSLSDIIWEQQQKAAKSAADNEVEVFGFSFSAYKDDVSAVTTEFTNLQKVVDKIDKGTYSTIEDGFGLLDSHPELLEYINDAGALKEKLVELQSAAPTKLVNELKNLRENLKQTGTAEQLSQIDALITALENLGKTAVATEKALTADDYLKIQTDGIDNIINKLKDEKDARSDILDNLNSQKDAIEEYYDAQISALKEENEERERNIELQEKQLALDNAKRNKVRIYTNRGFQIQEDTEAVTKAQRELDSAIKESQIADIEQQKSKATASIDKQIDAQKKEIEAYEETIKTWENYRKKVVEETNFITNINSQYLSAQSQFNLDEKSTFDEREANLKNHLQNIKDIMAETMGIDVDAILAEHGLLETNPIPNASTSKSKLFGADVVDASKAWLMGDGLSTSGDGIQGIGSIFKSMGNFAPTVTFNIKANSVDSEDIKAFWEKEIAMQYAEYKSGR